MHFTVLSSILDVCSLPGLNLHPFPAPLQAPHISPPPSPPPTHAPRFECSSTEAAATLVTQLQSHSWWGRTTPPHIVLLVNPSSGQGGSRAVLDSVLLPMLRDAGGLRVTVHMTDRRGHATDIVRGLDLSAVDLLAYVGGDGSIFEGVSTEYIGWQQQQQRHHLHHRWGWGAAGCVWIQDPA